MKFELDPLPYAKNALAPHLTEETLSFHYDKHHTAYLNNLKGLLEGKPEAEKSLEEIVKTSSGGVFNNAAQVWNHTFYWNSMKPSGGGEPSGALADAIKRDFGSFADFKKQFAEAAVKQFGSGWAWLVKDTDGALKVTKTENGVNPLVSGQNALLGVDVWEHSYYIDYRNARPKYLEAWVDNLINWEYVLELYEKAAGRV
jgi:Fe-Mn family superoxide dismutase